MGTLITLLIIVFIVAVLIWLINQIPFPAGFEMARFLAIAIVVIAAIIKVWPMLGSGF